jgi:TonB family protein
MRIVIVATLALYPMFLHAQASSPARTLSAANASSLHAALPKANELGAATPTRTSTAAAPVRISTGVVAPKLVHSVDVSSQGDPRWTAVPMRQTAVVQLVVDTEGKPTEMKIVHSLGATMDKNVLEAVSQYRFKPGSVSNQLIASPVNLEVEIRNQVY